MSEQAPIGPRICTGPSLKQAPFDFEASLGVAVLSLSFQRALPHFLIWISKLVGDIVQAPSLCVDYLTVMFCCW